MMSKEILLCLFYTIVFLKLKAYYPKLKAGKGVMQKA
jgi:hypothetical protein